MIEVTEIPTPQDSSRKIEIGNGKAKVFLPRMEISPEKELVLSVTTRRDTISIKDGDNVGPGNRLMIVDNKGKLADLRKQAKNLQSLPELERIRQLVHLVRSNLTYVRSEDQIQHLESARREVLHRRYFESNPLPTAVESLSQVVNDGIGVCNEFGSLYLVLANDAGLKGVNHIGSVRNQLIVGANELLVKHKPIGDGDFHFWAEIQLSNGEWLPVDPTIDFIGDELNKLETFRQAYRSKGSFLPNITGLPQGLTYERNAENFSFGEGTHSGPLKIRLTKRGDSQSPDYKGDINIVLTPRVNEITKTVISVENVKTT